MSPDFSSAARSPGTSSVIGIGHNVPLARRIVRQTES
jgi:hypothetical protein